MILSPPRNFGVCKFRSFIRLGSAVLLNRPFRNYSDSDKCEPEPEPKCAPPVLREYPCGLKPTQLHIPKPTPKRPELISMWKFEDCEPELCKMDLRYDMKYYRITDKRKRKYQVTWNECPRLLIKPKKVCLYEKLKRPKIVRRKRKAHSGGGSAAEVKTCAKEKSRSTCVYIKAPCCKVGRKPPKCRSAFKSLGGCTKRKAPYPSFSECKKDPPLEVPPTECKCLLTPATCDAWAELRRRYARGQPPAKRCGEA
ncbi:uncharacterized protein LOC133841381 [Drosophila sulfurigaster albostrigata]|uniref:uncharacterized protein LOC133841381 n=1 Tax=Drosophila sulfurigaster albostrigata TaxID=89887 RepID=UPI002D21878F|nr:uncharacterized protein LOC133841381 [Drosophila sulfurigaster albostrigata]